MSGIHQESGQRAADVSRADDSDLHGQFFSSLGWLVQAFRIRRKLGMLHLAIPRHHALAITIGISA